MLSSMAEKRIDISENQYAKLTRGSLGRTNTSTSQKKILPSNLGPSTSTRDFSKYGREHAIKAEERRPIQKGRTGVSDECKKPFGSVSQSQPKITKKPQVNTMLSIDSKLNVLDASKIIKNWTQLVKQVAPPSAKKTQVNYKPAAALKKTTIAPAKTNNVLAKTAVVSKMKPVTSKQQPSSLNPLSGGRKHNIIKTVENNGVSKLVQKKVMPQFPLPRLSAKAEERSKLSVIPEIIEAKDGSLRGLTGGTKTSIKREKFIPHYCRASTGSCHYFCNGKGQARNSRNLKGSSFPKSQNKVRKSALELPTDKKVTERETIYVIERKSEEKILDPTEDEAPSILWIEPTSQPPPPLSSSSSIDKEVHIDFQPTLDEENNSVLEEIESKNDLEIANEEYKDEETENKIELETTNVEYKYEDTENNKELETSNVESRCEETENNKEPDSENVDEETKDKKEPEETPGKAADDKSEKSGELESQRVDQTPNYVVGKIIPQPLFNNVIEETTSKLLEAKKTKVQALVGAFETVISLQENKNSQTNLSALIET